MKQLFRTKLIPGIIIFALALYAVIRLLTLQGEIAAINDELFAARRKAAELELDCARLMYAIENIENPDVKAEIAQTYHGLVKQGEDISYEGFSMQPGDD